MTREIPLGRGLVALVDDCDFEVVVRAGPWHARPHGQTVYAQRHVTRADGRRTTQQLHVFLMSATGIDHVNGDGLDNRRNNLRVASQQQNSCNRRARPGTPHGFKGITRRRSGRWGAQIGSNTGPTQTRWLGTFDTPELAARAYDEAALHHFGEFARPNFPKGKTA